MSAELLAIQAYLSTLDVPVHLGDATGSHPPFLVVWGSPGLRDGDESVGGSCGAFSAPFGITCTGQDAQAALDLAALVRDLIWQAQSPTVIPDVAGRHVVVDLYDARSVQVDRTVTLTTTNTHPAYVVLLGDVHSYPTPTEVTP